MHHQHFTLRSTSAPATVAGVGLRAMRDIRAPAASGRAASAAPGLRLRSSRPVKSTCVASGYSSNYLNSFWLHVGMPMRYSGVCHWLEFADCSQAALASSCSKHKWIPWMYRT